MNYFRTHKIIALFLAVLMILPLIPAVDLTVFAVGNALEVEGEPEFAPMGDILATINKNEITVYYGYANGNTGITVSGVRGEQIYLTRSVSYNGTIVLYEAFTTNTALMTYINSQYKYILASDVNLGGDPLPEETTTAPETTAPETTAPETNTSPGNITTEILRAKVLDKKAKMNPNQPIFQYYAEPSHAGEVKKATPTGNLGAAYSLDMEVIIRDAVVADNAIFFKVEVVSGTTVPPDLADYPWVHQMYVYSYTGDINAGPFIIAEDDVLITQADAVYNKLITIQTWEEWDAYCKSLDAATIELLKLLPEEKLVELDRISAGFYREKQLDMAPPAVDYTDVAPLVGFSKVVPAVYNARSGIARMALLANDVQPQAEETENGLILDKKAELKDGVYTITLEAYTTGSVTPGEATPSDIILVLDLSTSMEEDFASYNYTAVYDLDKSKNYYLYDGTEVEWCSRCNSWTTGCSGNYYHRAGEPKNPKTSASSDGVQFYTRTRLPNTISRIEALQEAMTSFIETVADQGTADRIALVGFHTSGVRLTGNSNATAFLDATEQESTLKSIISGLHRNLKGATEHGKGMELARQIFDAQSADTYNNRNKVVVMVTDGEPAPSNTNNWSSRTVKQAIEESYLLKSTHGATVYTISVMPGTDASNPTTSMDRYMDYMSSNYPDARFTASSFDNRNTSGDSYYDKNYVEIEEESEEIVNTIVPGTKVQTTGSYYLSAGNLEALDSIFGEIAEQTGGASMELDATTQIKDIISPYFTLPAGASKDDISVSTQDATYTNGTLGWTTSTIKDFNPTVTINGKNVSVDGFDFTHNFVAENGRVEGDVSQTGNFHGRKLIITFTITPDPDFLGGDNVVTNNELSGVYDKDGNEIERFEVPTTDVKLKEIDTVAESKHIYYGNTTDLTGILNLHVKASTSGKYLQEIANGINNAYVTLKYTVTINNKDVVYYTIPAGSLWNMGTWTDAAGDRIDMSKVEIASDTPYGIKCVMTSASVSTNYEQATGDAIIYVYKPTVTFKDSVQEYKKKSLKIDLTTYTDIKKFLEAHLVEEVTWSRQLTTTIDGVTQTVSISSTNSPMEGDEPTIEYEFSYGNMGSEKDPFANYEMNATSDVSVSVGVTIKGYHVTMDAEGTVTSAEVAESLWLKDLTRSDKDKITFAHVTCSHAGCKFNKDTEEFIVHVINAITSLTIKKDGWNSVDPNQTFLFTVTGSDAEGQPINLTVTVHEDDSVTIDGLIIGNSYTITEKVDWSWRYTFKSWTFKTGETVINTGTNNGAVIQLVESGNNITFENNRPMEYWLDGDSWCDNRFMANVTQAIN